ncbi:MAG TPA: MarR family transcriptional regulator [Thermoplasmataceae archaeon]|nr:MarR family transcriptional regulator [Thermoplasmatales archaeon AK]HLH86036.1 MarR family transcriptional regulator [Thermoplasmataceae archaeon]
MSKANKLLALLEMNKSIGLTQVSIQRLLGISKSYCSELLKTLEKNGLVIRVPGAGNSKSVVLAKYFTGPVPALIRVGLLQSTEYLPILKVIRDYYGNRNIEVLAQYYKNTRTLLNDASAGSLDIFLAPVTTLVLGGLVLQNIKVSSGIASGGSGIFVNREASNRKVLMSESSSMSRFVGLADLGAEGTIGFSDPSEGVRRFTEGEAKYIAIWEPFATHLRKRGYELAASYSAVLDDDSCCALGYSASNFRGRDQQILEIVKIYSDRCTNKVQAFYSDQDLRILCEVTGISQSRVEASLSNYSFRARKLQYQEMRKYGFFLTEEQFGSIVGFA